MKRLLEIQRRLKAPKNQRNNFGKYNYRSAEDILEAVKPLLMEQGLLLMLNDEVVLIGDRYYIKATATITDGAEFQVTNTAYARESETKTGMDASQITGTASSYARKYCLNGLLLIDDNKDADTDEYHKQTTGNVDEFAKQLKSSKTIAELQGVWSSLPPQIKTILTAVKDDMKEKLTA